MYDKDINNNRLLYICVTWHVFINKRDKTKHFGILSSFLVWCHQLKLPLCLWNISNQNHPFPLKISNCWWNQIVNISTCIVYSFTKMPIFLPTPCINSKTLLEISGRFSLVMQFKTGFNYIGKPAGSATSTGNSSTY